MNTQRFDFHYGERRFWDCEPETTVARTGNVNTFTYTLPDGLRLTHVVKEYEKFGAREWVTWFENTSDQPTEIISELWDCICTFPMDHEEPYRFTTMGSDPNTVTKIYAPDGSSWKAMEFYCDPDGPKGAHRKESYLYPGDTRAFHASGGRSSEAKAPFFNVHQKNHGVIFAIGWTGQWSCEISRGSDDITFRSGIEDAHFRLLPGEKIRTSSVVIMPYEGTVTEARNQWRRLVKEHFSLIGQKGRPAYGPLCSGTWGGMSTEQMLKRIALIKKHRLPFEYYWIDAGWYGMSDKPCIDDFEGDWSKHTGDWRVNPYSHPDGLKEVSAAVHEAGMKFLLWFEPERVISSTPVAREHPEYFLTPENEKNANRLLNLGDPEAWRYCFDTIAGMIEELNIDCYRQDFNIKPLDLWRRNDTEDRRSMTEIRHINGLYRLWDALLERFPHLIIDNCASGGRRIDIETLRRSVPLWRSDAGCPAFYPPEVAQIHTVTFGSWMPYSGTSPGQSSDFYRIRSAYGSCMTTNFLYNERDIAEVMGHPEKLPKIREYMEEYLAARPYFSEDIYPLTAPCDQSAVWSAVQFDSPEKKKGIVQVFRREDSPYSQATFTLGGVEKDRTYTFRDADDGSRFTLSGRELAESGLTLVIPQKRTAKLYFYEYES